ncbi:Gfo/Idh/MocA family oxidoreductase [Gluconobacter frateurii]|uniref:Gfo/Idh/MocA family protein n=1 Tax=Gluconobacter frateurii TaxID=38308 RepID=UPI001F05F637|nr:Gfo/Idh/MocA family oxidoreductase [Gluconobacter frateurii]UMM08675.1 Gfo/Idh/MocA family oxidoreductase [Gluconobacter frateurii]
MTDKKIRFAVVGGGQISQQAFMPGIARAPNAVLAALVTGDPEKGEKLAQEYNIPAYHYDDLPSLIASPDIDAFYLATPNALHPKHAIPILEGGKHLLLEKAMAGSVKDAEAIIAAQKKGGGKLMVAYRLHCEPGTVEMIDRSRNGEFGDILFFNASFGQNFAEANHRGHSGFWSGPVPDLGTYPLNALRNLIGREPVGVSAHGFQTPGRGFNFEDTVSVTLRFAEYGLATFTVSFACAPTEELRLVGTKASVRSSPCFMFGPDTGISYTVTTEDDTTSHNHPPTEQFGGEIAYFADCILKDQDPEPDGEEGLMDMRVLEAIERALATGKEQSLSPASRTRRPQRSQARNFPPVNEPEPNEMISIVPQSP